LIDLRVQLLVTRQNRDQRLRDIGSDASANSLLFAPIIVNEDCAAVAVDLARPARQTTPMISAIVQKFFAVFWP
jgi:hypothetical protein